MLERFLLEQWNLLEYSERVSSHNSDHLKKKEKKKKNVKLHLQVNVITMTSVIGHNRLRGGRIMSFHWPVNGDWAEFSQSIAHP